VTYSASLRLPPGEARGILQMDLGLVFPIVDLLLGGQGAVPQGVREVSQIEEAILEGICQIICHELEVVWQPLGLRISFEQRQPLSQMLRVMPAQEKTLTLTFEVGMTDAHGMFNITFPAVVSSALIRKLAGELVCQQAHGPAVHQEAIKQRLLESAVDLELCTPLLRVQLTELLGMRTGSIVRLQHRTGETALLRLKGQECWSALPVSSPENRRAAQIIDCLTAGEEVD
jgi:flagellar motor switch protein FliM